MILNSQSIETLRVVYPFVVRTLHKTGLSYGCGVASYDVTLGQDVVIFKQWSEIGVTAEHFTMPNNVAGFVKDKSSWARAGLSTLNTFIDPGWRGYLTLEFSYKPRFLIETEDKLISQFLRDDGSLLIPAGTPICQVVLIRTEGTAGYVGRYQDQPNMPVDALR